MPAIHSQGANDAAGGCRNNALGSSLAEQMQGNSSDVETENKGSVASLRRAKMRAVSGLSTLPADENALYLEPDQIERLESGRRRTEGQSLLMKRLGHLSKR
jgi:hypothetical protein